MEIARYLKTTCREYLRNNIAAAIYADEGTRSPNPRTTSPSNSNTTSPQTRNLSGNLNGNLNGNLSGTTNSMTTSSLSATTDHSYVAKISGEACLVTFDADQSLLVARPVGNLGLMNSKDALRVSSWTIVSVGLTTTTCTLTLSIAPYETVLDFGTGAAVQFVQRLQTHMAKYHTPFSVAVGGGYVSMLDETTVGGRLEEGGTVQSVADQYLSLVSATHGTFGKKGMQERGGGKKVWC